MKEYPTTNDEAGKPAALAEDERAAERRPQAFWEAAACDSLREIWDTPENEAWDAFYQQEQQKGNVPAI